jgi:hypothetical protein
MTIQQILQLLRSWILDKHNDTFCRRPYCSYRENCSCGLGEMPFSTCVLCSWSLSVTSWNFSPTCFHRVELFNGACGLAEGFIHKVDKGGSDVELLEDARIIAPQGIQWHVFAAFGESYETDVLCKPGEFFIPSYYHFIISNPQGHWKADVRIGL